VFEALKIVTEAGWEVHGRCELESLVREVGVDSIEGDVKVIIDRACELLGF